MVRCGCSLTSSSILFLFVVADELDVSYLDLARGINCKLETNGGECVKLDRLHAGKLPRVCRERYAYGLHCRFRQIVETANIWIAE